DYDILRTITLACSMKNDHKITIFHQIHFKDGKAVLFKIGQYPQLAALHNPQLAKYQKLLGKYYSELTRAVGLSSHGIGIGSFVYLRRIIESLIEEAHVMATSQPGWDEGKYKQSKVIERIVQLGPLLPDFLTENKESYSILSKGIHELGEEECKEHFPVMLETIEYILDEKLAKDERRVKRKEVANKLQGIHQQLKS
ncbi:MAG: short-chain dehydrogenase, partial [Thermodesulfobacteriota bacterium]